MPCSITAGGAGQDRRDHAEYGGALGGVVSAVTKSGGNEYSGETHHHFTGASTSAGPVQRRVPDPIDDRTVRYVQDVEQPNDRHEIGGSLGGPIVRAKLFFFGSWAPRYVRRSTAYLFTRSETDTIEQKQTFNSAFGKVNDASDQSPAHQFLGALDANDVGHPRWRRAMTRWRTRSPARRRRTRSRKPEASRFRRPATRASSTSR